MLSRPVNLAIVDDHALFRKILKDFLSQQEDINVAVQACDAFDLMEKLRTSSINILLMDVFLPEISGNEVVNMIRSEFPEMRILVLSMSTDMDLISDLQNAGIHGYVSKADDPEELLQAIRAVSDNRIYRNRLFTEALYWNKQNGVRSFIEGPDAALNEREKKILQLIWEEKSSKEIADLLFLGIRSIEKIRQDMKEKTGIKSTVGLLKYALARKIISVDPRLPVSNAIR